MTDLTIYEKYLKEIGEIGFVQSISRSIVNAVGLPDAHPFEAVVFETGDIGQIISLGVDTVEILLLGNSRIIVGTKVVRTGDMLQVPMSSDYLGRVIDPLGKALDAGSDIKSDYLSAVDTQPHGIIGRSEVEKPLVTGVTIVDIIIPIAKGQRELVIGDRKTGKTDFLLQTLLSQSQKGTVCIYASIGQRSEDIKNRVDFIKRSGIEKNCIVVATSSSDPSGLIFFTPFTAMTIAEYFRDKGIDVLLILDDLTTHARVYREISLLAKRFPGRSAYPGDIFYLHSRLIERAGNYKKGSISCLPVAETIMGDLSGYLQTNLMAMTDGHIYFDIDLYNQGRRPAVSPYLSVTRIGHQAQTPLQRDVSRQLLSFLVSFERMKQFMHFGAEVGETVKGVLDMGKRIETFFSQSTAKIIPLNVNIIILAAIWVGYWAEGSDEEYKRGMESIYLNYQNDDKYRDKIDLVISKTKTFLELVNMMRREGENVIGKV